MFRKIFVSLLILLAAVFLSSTSASADGSDFPSPPPPPSASQSLNSVHVPMVGDVQHFDCNPVVRLFFFDLRPGVVWVEGQPALLSFDGNWYVWLDQEQIDYSGHWSPLSVYFISGEMSYHETLWVYGAKHECNGFMFSWTPTMDGLSASLGSVDWTYSVEAIGYDIPVSSPQGGVYFQWDSWDEKWVMKGSELILEPRSGGPIILTSQVRMTQIFLPMVVGSHIVVPPPGSGED